MAAPERSQLITLIHEFADAARVETLRHFRQSGLTADNKSADGFDPVTIADRAVEQLIRDRLAQMRPDDGITGEEFAPVPTRSGLTWVIDPIDGTRSFLSGSPCWGVLIAVADQSGPFLGVIDQPYIGERFLGGLGMAEATGPQGAAALHCRATPDLRDAILFSTFPEIGTDDECRAFQRVSTACRLTRYGMDCYAYALLALGQIDLVIEAGLNVYDIAAPIAVIEAAGGIVTNWQGGAVGPGGQALAAANPDIHAQAMALLNA
ncbi:inositol monophosphatase family protein [Roseinatronobacter sp. HJB301]|uniref:Inositol monophosphatase family protein n=1 Tax=Roseinatronobacter alkalisoli TaxID=3028235 RepID=A0ABT5T543_9RHOB|nr:inositol monophosphatase family protein [Roseinatronobacter sp. HJB301]MDD7970242.1 inositol monophosphatase family protein [Roseinatronobacter sp. HJB301]